MKAEPVIFDCPILMGDIMDGKFIPFVLPDPERDDDCQPDEIILFSG